MNGQSPPDSTSVGGSDNGERGDSSLAPASPGTPPGPGGKLSQEEALERLERYWEGLHCILWFDWDLGRPDCKQRAREGALKFLIGMDLVESESSEMTTSFGHVG